jgi:hypothetical protein
VTGAWRIPPRLIAVDGGGRDAMPAAAAAALIAGAATRDAGILLRPSPRADAILTALPPPAAVIAVLPDVAQLLRDAGQQGAPRAALHRLGRGGLAAAARLFTTGITHVRQLAAQDFSGLVPALIALERAGLGNVPLDAIAVAAPLTDLLLAAGHREALAHLVAFLRRSGVRAGFETLNLGHLLARLHAWSIATDFVIGPVNARGFRMKPSPDAVLAGLRGSLIPVIASEVTAMQTCPLEEAVTWARAHGATSAVVTIADLAASAAAGAAALPAAHPR